MEKEQQVDIFVDNIRAYGSVVDLQTREGDMNKRRCGGERWDSMICIDFEDEGSSSLSSGLISNKAMRGQQPYIFEKSSTKRKTFVSKPKK